MKKRKLFCEISPICYNISLKKECLLRDFHDAFDGGKFAAQLNTLPLEAVVKSHESPILRRLEGVDMTLQRSKAHNLLLACSKINGILIHPGETFSFWRLVGEPSEKRGYQEGLGNH